MGSTSDSPPSFKPPPPPAIQRRPSRKAGPKKRPSSGSSHSGLYFTAPLQTPTKETKHSKHPTASPDAPKKVVPAAQLSMVSQHHIGPFPRVQSPSRTKPATVPPNPPPAPAVPAPIGPPPVSSPEKNTPSSPGSNQHFVMVEVHRPNAEPDVNEVRPLPQARGEDNIILQAVSGFP